MKRTSLFIFFLAAFIAGCASVQVPAIDSKQAIGMVSTLCSSDLAYSGAKTVSEFKSKHQVCDIEPSNRRCTEVMDTFTSGSAHVKLCRTETGYLVTFKGSTDARDFAYDVAPVGEWYLDGYAEVIYKATLYRMLIDSSDKPKSLNVYGHSLGGYLAYGFAAYIYEQKENKKFSNIDVSGFNSIGIPDRYLQTYEKNKMCLGVMFHPVEYRCAGDVTSLLGKIGIFTPADNTFVTEVLSPSCFHTIGEAAQSIVKADYVRKGEQLGSVWYSVGDKTYTESSETKDLRTTFFELRDTSNLEIKKTITMSERKEGSANAGGSLTITGFALPHKCFTRDELHFKDIYPPYW